MKNPIFVVAAALSLATLACSIAGTGPLPTPTAAAPTPTANSSVASVPTLASNTDSQSSNIPTLVMAGGAQNQSLSSGGSPTIGSLTVNPSVLGKGNPPAFEVAVGTAVTVQVDGVQADSTVTFYVAGGGGPQQALGSAIPNGSVASLVWPVPAQVGQSYVLYAEAMNTQGLTARSQPITVM
ncbi:MAG TPA: hypothetical protein VKQ72_22270, partial [Aggregatilineales bacterium]|nr:hypothetical protein [Aggregatilineales bacterium]